jgi:death on curing protein
MIGPVWVSLPVVIAIHEAQVAEHGGSVGIRDQGLLESALARPQNLNAYEESASVYDLAAAYAVGIAKNHAFLDGNKRTAWVICGTFLRLNGIDLLVEEPEVVAMMVGAAAGSVSERQFSRWLQAKNPPAL